MVFSLPSVLMPLVSPYLHYEEVCECMTLNSDFRDYIENNWKVMPKKVIWIMLVFSDGNLGKIFLRVLFGDSYKTEWKNSNAIYCDGIEIIPFMSGSLSYVDIHDSTVQIWPNYQRTFMHEYMRKRCVAGEGVQFYVTGSRENGLKLVLDALSLRFSISYIALKSLKKDVVEEASSEALFLQYLAKCLSSRYKPEDGLVTVRIDYSDYSPLLAEFAKSIGADQNYMLLSADTKSIDLLKLDTNVFEYCITQCSGLDISQIVLSGLITEWKGDRRTIKSVTIKKKGSQNYMDCQYRERRIVDTQNDAEFQGIHQMFQDSGFHMTKRLESDEPRRNLSFELCRKDGRILRASVYADRQYIFVFIHEHEQNCDCYQMLSTLKCRTGW